MLKVARLLKQATELYKYPRTFHIPGSPGATSDDKVLSTMDHFHGQDVVITEKMDGENTTIYPDAMHSRSLDSNNHPSRNWVKKLQSEVGYQIPTGMRICGENVFAQHSIGYNELPSYFLVFSIWEGNTCLSWDETEFYCKELGLHTVPVLYRGTFDEQNLEQKFFSGTSAYGGDQEGFVVRLARTFNKSEFSKALAKWVRPNHVQPDAEHWTKQPVVPNKMNA